MRVAVLYAQILKPARNMLRRLQKLLVSCWHIKVGRRRSGGKEGGGRVTPCGYTAEMQECYTLPANAASGINRGSGTQHPARRRAKSSSERRVGKDDKHVHAIRGKTAVTVRGACVCTWLSYDHGTRFAFCFYVVVLYRIQDGFLCSH